MKLQIQAGVTSYRTGIFVQDSSSTTGAGLAALLFSSTGLAWRYWRQDEGNVASTAVTLATMTRGTWATGGFIQKDATNMIGFYEIGIPNAALATGSDWVLMELSGAANMAPVTIEIQLVAESDANLGNQAVTLDNVTHTGATIPDVTTVTGNVNGSVASVTGAVGSVTGAVGSVTGSVGSVTGAVGSVTAQVSADMTAVSGDTTAADRLEAYFDALHSGTASAGSANSLTLTGAVATNDYYNGALLVLTGGPGAGQFRLITDYAATLIATVEPNWITTPTGATTFIVLPQARTRIQMRQNVPVSPVADTLEAGLRAAINAEVDTQDIQGRIPTTLTSGRMNSNVEALNNDTVPVVNIALNLNTIVVGTCTGTPTATVIAATGVPTLDATDDHYNGRIMIFTSGVLNRQATDITDYAGATTTFTVTAVTDSGPASGDTFVII